MQNIYKTLIAALGINLVASLPFSVPSTCPDLPPAPHAKHFSINAQKITLPTQTLSYNGTAVGPLIKVNLGDLVQVDVTNVDIPAGTSVHWHGQNLKNSAWADGPAGVNQYPIPQGFTFSYRFQAEPAGTYWYHSHTSAQFGDGLRGPLIVMDPNDPHVSLYDHDLDEHVLMIADVFSTTVEAQLAKLQAEGMSMKPLCNPSLLNQDISDAPWFGAQVNGQGYLFDNTMSGSPLVINVKQGQRYRLRWIGGMSSWAMQLAIQQHSFDIIALDGRPVEPIKGDSYIITPGERIDMVLNANAPMGNYWIDISTINGFNSPVILHYEGAVDPLQDSTFLSTLTKDFGCNYGVGGRPGMIDGKNATFYSTPTTQPPPAKADKQFVIYLPDASASSPPSFFNNTFHTPSFTPQNGSCPDGTKYCWSMNWVVYENNQVSPNLFYTSTKPTNRSYNLDLVLGEAIDLILINPSTMVHPMHLHGSSFHVLASGNGFPINPSTGTLLASIPLNLKNPPVRDTMPVAQALNDKQSNYGYAVLRFTANNPGPWSFHCHIDLHAGSGMFMTLTTHPKSSSAPWNIPSNMACSK